MAAIVVGCRAIPDTPADRRRFWLALVLLVVAPLAAFAVVAAIVVARGAPALDLSLLRSAARHQNPAAIGLAQAVTFFGAALVVLVMLTAAAGLLWRARLRRRAAFVVVATLLAMTASGLMKLAFARPRPEVFRQTPGSWSFPSGHTTSATGFAVALVIGSLGHPLARACAGRRGALRGGRGPHARLPRLSLSDRRRRRLGARVGMRWRGVAFVRAATRRA